MASFNLTTNTSDYNTILENNASSLFPSTDSYVIKTVNFTTSPYFDSEYALRKYQHEMFKSMRKLFYQPSISVIIMLSVLYSIISVLSLLGNGLVIWVVAASRKMRTVTNLYIANLAVSDVILGVFCIPFQFQAALRQRWDLPESLCSFCPFVQVRNLRIFFNLNFCNLSMHA